MICTAIIQFQYKAPHSYGNILELTVKLNLTMVCPKFAQVQYKSLHIHKRGHFKFVPHTFSTISTLILSEILTVLVFQIAQTYGFLWICPRPAISRCCHCEITEI